MSEACVEHLQMDIGVLVTRESEIADLTGFLGGERRLKRTVGPEDAVRIAGADDFMELHKVDRVGLEPAE